MGQWIQEGERTIYETVISVEKTQHSLQVPSDEANLDGLNFLAGKHVDEVNKMAELGTQLAHVDGGVPNMRIVIPALNEESIGGLLYFFEKHAVSAVICWESIRSTNRVWKLQEEYVRTAEQAGLRRRIQSYPGKTLIN